MWLNYSVLVFKFEFVQINVDFIIVSVYRSICKSCTERRSENGSKGRTEGDETKGRKERPGLEERDSTGPGGKGRSGKRELKCVRIEVQTLTRLSSIT
jgi:hypothetical protein